MLTRNEEHALISLAAAARQRAHAPYSGHAVGSAVVAADSRVFSGCNVENASLGLSLCAERAAIASAVCAGVRSIAAVVLVTGRGEPVMPCGACLQWIAEFEHQNTLVVSATVAGKVRRAALRDLLKEPFQL